MRQALAGIGRQRKGTTPWRWTMAEVRQWCGFAKDREARLSVEWLVEAGLAEPVAADGPPVRFTAPQWQLTRPGMEAAADAVRQAAQLRAAERRRAKGDTPTEFSTRLWSLLRIRTVLTANQAASILVDADSNVGKAERSASQHLQRWHRLAPHAVAESAQRVEGQKRYVLVKDLGPTPPTTPSLKGVS